MDTRQLVETYHNAWTTGDIARAVASQMTLIFGAVSIPSTKLTTSLLL